MLYSRIMSNYQCYHCKATTEVNANQKVDFRESCPSCSKDLHCCMNCLYYDTGAYNSCKENQAEKVPDKVRLNRCEYFRFTDTCSTKASTTENHAKQKLEDLFK